MKTTSLYRLGGIAVLLAVVLFAIASLMYFLSGQGPATTWRLWIAILGTLFMVLGLDAVYTRQAQGSGWLGLIGFVLLMWGNLQSVGSRAVSLGVAEGVFSADQVRQVSSYTLVDTIATWIWVLGQIIFGLSIYRARVYPKYAGALLMLLGLVEALTGPLVLARPIYAILSAIAWGWLGWELWTSRNERRSTS